MHRRHAGGPTTQLNSNHVLKHVEMSCRERTVEYKSIVQAKRSRQTGAYVKQNGAVDVKAQRSQFNTAAGSIGKNIASTCEKLEKLTILASNKSLFDDHSTEIAQLTRIVKEDIGGLNGAIGQLQTFCRNSIPQTNKHVNQHSSSVVVCLQSKLADMSTSFKGVLETRTENLKQQKQRRDQFSSGPVSTTLPGEALTGYTGGSLLLQSERESREDTSIDFGDSYESQGQQSQQLALIDQQDTYIQSRQNDIETIESTIVELGQIFQQLAHMVQEQEETVRLIDTNVSDIQMNVEAAHSELLKYFQNISSNRWLMIKVFMILIVFFVVFVVFMA